MGETLESVLDGGRKTIKGGQAPKVKILGMYNIIIVLMRVLSNIIESPNPIRCLGGLVS